MTTALESYRNPPLVIDNITPFVGGSNIPNVTGDTSLCGMPDVYGNIAYFNKICLGNIPITGEGGGAFTQQLCIGPTIVNDGFGQNWENIYCLSLGYDSFTYAPALIISYEGTYWSGQENRSLTANCVIIGPTRSDSLTEYSCLIIYDTYDARLHRNEGILYLGPGFIEIYKNIFQFRYYNGPVFSLQQDTPNALNMQYNIVFGLWPTGSSGPALVHRIINGPPTDSLFRNPQDGMTSIDSSQNRIYVRIAGTWRYASLT